MLNKVTIETINTLSGKRYAVVVPYEYDRTIIKMVSGKEREITVREKSRQLIYDDYFASFEYSELGLQAAKRLMAKVRKEMKVNGNRSI